MDFEQKNIRVFGVNDKDQKTVRSWVERESLPFPIILDTDRSIAIAYAMSKTGDERYLANPAEGSRPAVIVDEVGLIFKFLPDLSTVDEQAGILANLT